MKHFSLSDMQVYGVHVPGDIVKTIDRIAPDSTFYGDMTDVNTWRIIATLTEACRRYRLAYQKFWRYSQVIKHRMERKHFGQQYGSTHTRIFNPRPELTAEKKEAEAFEDKRIGKRIIFHVVNEQFYKRMPPAPLFQEETRNHANYRHAMREYWPLVFPDNNPTEYLPRNQDYSAAFLSALSILMDAMVAQVAVRGSLVGRGGQEVNSSRLIRRFWQDHLRNIKREDCHCPNVRLPLHRRVAQTLSPKSDLAFERYRCVLNREHSYMGVFETMWPDYYGPAQRCDRYLPLFECFNEQFFNAEVEMTSLPKLTVPHPTRKLKGTLDACKITYWTARANAADPAISEHAYGVREQMEDGTDALYLRLPLMPDYTETVQTYAPAPQTAGSTINPRTGEVEAVFPKASPPMLIHLPDYDGPEDPASH